MSHIWPKRLINKTWENPSLQKRNDGGRWEYANYTNKFCNQYEYSHIVQYVICLLCQGKEWGSLNWSLNAIIDVCAIIWLLTSTKPQRETGLSHLFTLDVNVLYQHHTIQLTKATWWTEGRDRYFIYRPNTFLLKSVKILLGHTDSKLPLKSMTRQCQVQVSQFLKIVGTPYEPEVRFMAICKI